MEQKKKVVYVTNNGLLEQLGSSQIVPYVHGLANDFDYIVISCEKKSDLLDRRRKNILADKNKSLNIAWYYRNFVGGSVFYKLLDIIWLNILFLYVCLKYKPDLLHTRGHVPTFSLLLIAKILSMPNIFDIRGFEVDSMLEINRIKKTSLVYRILKFIEKVMVRYSTAVNVLSEKARTFLIDKKLRFENDIISVIPTCVDISRFYIDGGSNRNVAESLRVCWLGNAGEGYNFDLAVEVFNRLWRHCNKIHFTIINKHDHDLIEGRIRQLKNCDFEYEIISVDYPDIPEKLNACNGAVFFYKWFNDVGKFSVPTRLGELLACGVPCFSMRRSGACLDKVEKDGCMVLVGSVHDVGLDRKVEEFVRLMKEENIGQKCRNTAVKYFSLEDGVSSYRKLINSTIDLKSA